MLAIYSGSIGHAQGPLRERLGKKLAEAKAGVSCIKRVTWKTGTTERDALVYVSVSPPQYR